ncbi:hypothetical protein, variant 1 [Aphanomyces invadans]|uniref:Sister chromatid cohesion protein n=1 Tax=Aphanomyces invadans TaxID=157072 RepID=A0A024U039_9STRA|nr:hypothetical protein, variant 1 [Aphanomyces invadans]ETV99256.1 hypothetical protein, variant 1 [Aphanomyces invadans]|eukprot:XP_008871812.1 hypothetical protein, variant 1 [Aphanomyces invadans]
MSNGLPLYIPREDGEDGNTSIWEMPPAPITYANLPPVEASRLNLASLNNLLSNVPLSLLPDHNPPAVLWDTMSPLLRAVVTDVHVLSPNVQRPQPPSKKHKTSAPVYDLTTPEHNHQRSSNDATKGHRLPRAKVIEIADEDDDGPSTPLAGDTQESKKKAIVQKYEDELHGLLGCLSTAPEVSRVMKKIMQTMQLLHKSHKELIQHLSFDLLGDLMSLLDTRVTDALTIDLFAVAYANNGDADWEVSGIDYNKLNDIVCAMDAASCMLYIMTSPNIDRRLLSEEYIEHCISLLKHVLQRLLCPSLDNLSLSKLLQESKSSVHPKYHGALKKKIDKVGLVHILSTYLETIEELVTGIKLQDSWILTLSNALIDTFSLEGSQATQANICLLQVRASGLFRGIFLHYPTHRALLIDDIFSVLLKLPSNKRNLRTFKLSHGDIQVQMISMLLVTLVQSCVRVSLENVREAARVIVHSFVQKCMKKEESNDCRQTFENFVDDLLVMLTSPEWPAVQLILESLSGGLTSLMAQQKANKLESQTSLLALHLLGKICATIRQITCEANAQPIQEMKHPPALVECREQAIQLLASKQVQITKANLVECMVLMHLGEQSTHMCVDAEVFHRAQCSFSDEFISLKANVTLTGTMGRLLVTELVSHRELCQHFDQMLMAIMAFLTRGQPTFRARVLKALMMIVDSDPLLMGDDHLHQAITLSLSDEATSVRQSAVELVGKYIGLQPMLFPKYFAMLADRLRDKGISVRKSVLRIFKVYLQYTTIEPTVAESVSKALRALVERIGIASEEESVKDTVLSTLQDVWFGARPTPPSNRRGQSNQETTVTPSCLRKKSTNNYKVLSMIDVVHHVHNPEWMVALICRLIKKNADEMETACSTMVSELMEFLLQLEEGHALPLLSFDDKEAQRLATLKTLHVICEASPKMVLPYLDTLTVYLKQDDRLSKPTQMHVLAMAAAMIGLVIPCVEKPVEKWMVALENDLKSLVLGAPPQVVKPAVECLATLTTCANRQPKLLLKILEMLYTFLLRSEALIKLDKPISDKPNLLRSLFVAGLVAGSLEWGALPHFSSAIFTKEKLVDMVYEVYERFCKVSNTHVHFDGALRVKTVQGLGMTILHQDPKVRAQILASLTELLQAEEARLEKLHSQGSKQGKDYVQGDQEGDASLIGGVMIAQLDDILKVAVQKEASIRSQAIACIGLLLTQGLIPPMRCIPTLIALETDQVAFIRDAAHMHLVSIHGKFPNMVSGPAIQGIYSSYQFQTRAFGKSVVCDSENVCLLGRMYRACFQGNRSQRHAFYNGLLGAFREKGPMFTALAEKRLPVVAALGYLIYVAQLLSVLPYDVEDEPLYLVYTINRDVSLGLGTVQDKMKKFLGKDASFDNLPVTDPVKPELVAVGHSAFGLALLVRLKMALKAAYLLDNEKCQTFQTTNTTKANEAPVSRASLDTAILNVPDMVADDVMNNSWLQLKLLGNAASDDQAQLDFDWENPQLTKKKGVKLHGKRGRKRKEKKADSGDDDDVQVDDIF